MRARIIIDGIVQGVGLRYNASILARTNNLKGYIKNLEDGTVEIICEGEKENIDTFIKELRDLPKPISIDNIHINLEEERGEFKGFKIITGDLAAEMVEGFSTWCIYLKMIVEELKAVRVVECKIEAINRSFEGRADKSQTWHRINNEHVR